MAMQRPHPRIIRLELHRQMTFPSRRSRRRSSPLSQHLRVPPLQVRLVPLDRAVPDAGPLGQDEEVVAVEVHGVGGVGCVDEVCHVYYYVGRGGGVVDVPLGGVGVGYVAFVGFEEDRVAGWELDFFPSLLAWGERSWISLLVVGVEGGVVHEPLQAAVVVSSVRAVVSEIDVQIYRKVCFGVRLERV